MNNAIEFRKCWPRPALRLLCLHVCSQLAGVWRTAGVTVITGQEKLSIYVTRAQTCLQSCKGMYTSIIFIHTYRNFKTSFSTKFNFIDALASNSNGHKATDLIKHSQLLLKNSSNAFTAMC